LCSEDSVKPSLLFINLTHNSLNKILCIDHFTILIEICVSLFIGISTTIYYDWNTFRFSITSLIVYNFLTITIASCYSCLEYMMFSIGLI
jgi:hypothetical protein